MRYHWSIAIAVAVAGCASNNSPPASSASVEQASDTPSTGPSFAPASNDGTATAAANSQPSAVSGTRAEGTEGQSAVGQGAASPPGPVSNAAATPAPTSGATAPDNSGINARDRGSDALTPMDQGKSEADRKVTQQIRQAIVKDSSLSFTAKNVKIITQNGKVVLRGPVKTDAEKASIEAAARKVAGDGQVQSLLEVSK